MFKYWNGLESREDKKLNLYYLTFLINLLNSFDFDIEIDNLLIYKEYKREVSLEFIERFFSDVKEYLISMKFAEAYLIIDLIIRVVKGANINKFNKELDILENQIEIKRRELLVSNKKRIHKSVYEESLKKCNMYYVLSSACNIRKKSKKRLKHLKFLVFLCMKSLNLKIIGTIYLRFIKKKYSK